MGTLTIRNLPTETQQGLREIAAKRGRSMEAEARAILDEAVRREKWLSAQETESLSPEAQTALARLRAAFAERPGESKRSLVDDFLSERGADWGDDA